ncbi:MAG: NADH-quinone oxidoreductase subunit J [Bacteroidales bacterium]|nr:NADH-quinone oxidoreductase subunit J [Bacteroidales bacterium]
MNAQDIMFVILAVFIALSSIATVVAKSIVRAATYLFFVLIGTAGLYFLMGYTFLGSVQTMVYAGGIIVLYVFSIFLTSGQTEELSQTTKGKIFSGALLAVVGIAVFATVLWTHNWVGSVAVEALSKPSEDIISMETIGTQMLATDKGGFLLPFEVVSVLLLACIVAGLVIARKR